VKLDWDAMIGMLAPNGRLACRRLPCWNRCRCAAFSLILQQRSVSGSPTGSPVAIETMLDFASRHNIVPQTERFPMRKINDAFRPTCIRPGPYPQSCWTRISEPLYHRISFL
jgi:uncharacterized zinc-type alcohol dehydrogenase-like protein